MLVVMVKLLAWALAERFLPGPEIPGSNTVGVYFKEAITVLNVARSAERSLPIECLKRSEHKIMIKISLPDWAKFWRTLPKNILSWSTSFKELIHFINSIEHFSRRRYLLTEPYQHPYQATFVSKIV